MDIFKCFACGECGDSIALVSKLKGLNNYESTLYINKLLNLGLEVKEDKYIDTNNKAKDSKISVKNGKNIIGNNFSISSYYENFKTPGRLCINYNFN